MARHLLVGNPTAQSGKNRERVELALKSMNDAGIAADLLPTLPEGKTIGAVRTALEAGSYRTVVAMGGDGTFREVAAGLYTSTRREEVALGMLPTGTANDQGRSFGLHADKDALAVNVDVIRAAHETRLDAGIYRAGDGKAEADYFFDSCGWGLSARVLAQRNKDRAVVEALGPLKELYRDQAVYAGAFLKTFLESYVVDDKFRVVATLDGQRVELEGLTDLIVKNTRVYAGAWVFDEASRHDDGIFELVPFVGKLDWASKAIRDLEVVPLNENMLEEIGLEHSKTLRASTMELDFFEPEGGAALATQLDGEEWPAHRHVRIEVAARALRLIVPALWLLISLGSLVACGGRYESSPQEQPDGGKGGLAPTSTGSAGRGVAGAGGTASAGGAAPDLTHSCRAQQQAYADYRAELVAQFSSFTCMQASDCVVFYNQTSCDSSCVLTTTAAKRGVIDGLNNFALGNCSSDCLPTTKPSCGSPPPPYCSNGQCVLVR